MREFSFTGCIFILSWITGLTTASPLPQHSVEELSQKGILPLRQRQTSGTVAITGVQNAGVQPRLEIREMMKDSDMFNLYLLGLRHFMDTPESDKLSYHSICSIHGRPYGPFDGVNAAPGVTEPGYCTHLSNLFAQWHRAYVLLFEQTLFEHIIAVVNMFPAGPIRQRLAEIAPKIRQPWWDWAAVPSDGGSVWPDIFSQENVTVTGPNGTITIHNPLYSYTFQNAPGVPFAYNPVRKFRCKLKLSTLTTTWFASWTNTKRYPTAWTSSAKSQDNLLGPLLDNSRNNRMNRVYNLLAYDSNFSQFSNEAWIDGNVRNADSLESLHDDIHDAVGQNGHMTYLDYAAFDMSFWFHHCMLDRIFAFWQNIYPESYVEPMAAISQTYVIKIGDIMDIDSPLKPFHSDDQGTFHTSRTVVDPTAYGYTYPELMNMTSGSLIATINQMYGANAAAGGILKRSTVDSCLEERSNGYIGAAPGEQVDGMYRHYTANIVSQKHAVNGSYAIYVFLGDPDADSTNWPTDPNLVGTHSIFASVASQAYALPGADTSLPPQGAGGSSNVQVSGTVPLTDSLLAKVNSGDLSSMDDDAVQAYLQDNLNWGVSIMDGTPVDPSGEVDVTITVVTQDLQPAGSTQEFPTLKNFQQLDHITRGKAGGCK